MNVLGTTLFIANSVAFLLIGFVFQVRLKEAKGSLRFAKISIVMAAFCAAGGFLITSLSQFAYDPLDSQNLLVKQLYVPANLFVMLVLAFLASFAVFATYVGRGRKLIVLLIFIASLTPTAYLALTYNGLSVAPVTFSVPESYELTLTPEVMILFALCGIPLGLMPLVAFVRSFIMARRRGDKVLARRAAMMLSAVTLSLVALTMFVFPFGILRYAAVIIWIPIELFLLYAVLRTTSPVKG
jgi:hypothetical protein